MDREAFALKIESQLVNMLTDPVFSIREETANSLIELSKAVYDQSWLDALVGQKIEELGRHQTFMIRIHAVHLMNSMHTHISRQTISGKYAKALIKLAEDPVPNIRFNVSKSVKTYWAHWSREHQQQMEQLLRKMAESDPDFDAKYFASKALEEIRLVK